MEEVFKVPYAEKNGRITRITHKQIFDAQISKEKELFYLF